MKKIFYALAISFFCYSCTVNEQLNSLEIKDVSVASERPPIQELPFLCGTKGSNKPMPLSDAEIIQMFNETLVVPPPGTPIPVRHIRIKYHIVTLKNGSGGISENNLFVMTENLNTVFSNPLLKNPEYSYPGDVLTPQIFYERLIFDNTEINYINNDELYGIDFTEGSDEAELEALFNTDRDPSMLNIYIVNHITSNGLPISGLVEDFGTNALAITGSKQIQSRDPYILAHEVGHNLSLRHTFHNSENLCVQDNDSTSTGDMIADTPVDIGLGSEDFDICDIYTGNKRCVSSEGKSIGTPSSQAKFIAKNIMSYVPDCRNSFTVLQMMQNESST